MFPKKDSDPYIKSTGERSTLGQMIGSGGGGGGGSVTPDYKNNKLLVGTSGDFEYFIPMSKRYIGTGAHGYEIKTNPESSAQVAMVDVYSFILSDGEKTELTLLKTLHHNGDSTYLDSNIKLEYVTSGTKWRATLLTDMYEVSDSAPVSSPVEWSYNTVVDYNWFYANE